MIKVILIEDEEPARARLKRLFSQLKTSIEVIAEIETVKGAISFLSNIKENAADLIFLDIHLADGNSFEIFDLLDTDIPIIFTTAYDQYAVQAFGQHSLAYLLKPIGLNELQGALDKYQRVIAPNKPEIVDYESLIAGLRGLKKDYKKRFLVYKGPAIQVVSSEEIAWFIAENRKVKLMTLSGSSYQINFTIEKLEMMIDGAEFFRVNRHFILHIQAFEELVSFSRTRYLLKSKISPQKEIFLPVDRLKTFKEWLAQ